MRCPTLPSIPRPLQRHLIVSFLSLSIFFTAFLLFLLVGLSLPIIKSIYIIEVSAAVDFDPISNAATTLKFGVWGLCALSTFDAATEAGVCFGPKLGYTIPEGVTSTLSIPSGVVSGALTALLTLLVIHLVVAALSTCIFVLSFFLHSHATAIIALILAIIAAILSSFVFAVDVALVLVVKDNVNSLISGAALNVTFGNGVWMILVGMILTWVAVVVLSARVCYCCGVRRQRVPKNDDSSLVTMDKNSSEKSA